MVFAIDLSFGLSSSDSEEFAPQILGFSGEANGQGPFASQKSIGDASKLPESEGEKPKTQVISILILMDTAGDKEGFVGYPRGILGS